MNDNISGWNTWSDAFAGWTDVTISEIHGLMTGLMTSFVGGWITEYLPLELLLSLI